MATKNPSQNPKLFNHPFVDNRRHQNQIVRILEIFEKALSVFQSGKPIDNWLSQYFRSNRQIGSKDRKRISNAIFGYFRWYGWLRHCDRKDNSFLLLIGYLLDGNPVDETIRFWKELLNCQELDFGMEEFPDKKAAFCKFVKKVKISDLVPEIANDWSDSLIVAMQKRPSIWIRAVEEAIEPFFKKLKKNNIRFRIHKHLKECIEILSPINLYEYPEYKTGQLEVQDISSQGVGIVCQPKQGEIWWDVCAGSGGKSLQLSSLMNRKGIVYASEVESTRFDTMQKRIKRTSFSNSIKPIHWDGDSIPAFSKMPNNVLVDAPCSCSGTWRRSPELRWRISTQTIREYADLQSEILETVKSSVPLGGRLVYATCSAFEEENEKVTRKFLLKNQDFSQKPFQCPFTGKSTDGSIRFQPPEVDGNIMFVASLIRNK